MTHYFPTRRYSDLDRHGGHLRHELREPAWHGNHLGLPRGPGCHGIRMRRALLAIPVARLAPAFQAKCARHARGPQGGVRRVLVGSTPYRRNGPPSYVLGPELGIATCRGRGCQYVWIPVVAVSLQKKQQKTTEKY